MEPPTEAEMRAKLAEVVDVPDPSTRRRRRRTRKPRGPSAEDVRKEEIRAEAVEILEQWRASFTSGLRAKESSDEEFDEKKGVMVKLTLKQRKARRKMKDKLHRRAERKARGGRLAGVAAFYRTYIASKKADGTRAGREYRLQTITFDKKGKEVLKADESGAKFPPSLMDQQAFLTLERWALRYKITQGEMHKVYDAFLENLHAKKHPDDSHKIPNRISTYFFQDLFDHQTSEATSLILIPLLFVKDLHGLKRARDVGCITFPRFLIAGYEFARQSPCGVTLKFLRLLLDPHACDEKAYVPLKPFEDLVSLMHGGTPKGHLHLFAALFGEKTHVRFPDLVRACCACPVLLRPLRLFHAQFQRKFFWSEFWARHQRPCLDPEDEALFGPLMVSPALERSLVTHATLEKAWRLTAKRLLGWVRVRATIPSSDYWLGPDLDACRDLEDPLVRADAAYVFATTALLRSLYGLRFGKLLSDLLFDAKPFATGALYDALWKAYDTPLRVAIVAGGADLNPGGDTTATPRRRPVREWPAPVPQDGQDFLRRRPADAMTLGWQKFTDPATDRAFHYHVASHTSQWLDPRHDYTFAGHDGRAAYHFPEREALQPRQRSYTFGDLELAGAREEPQAAEPAPAPAPAGPPEPAPAPKLSVFGRLAALSPKKQAEGASAPKLSVFGRLAALSPKKQAEGVAPADSPVVEES